VVFRNHFHGLPAVIRLGDDFEVRLLFEKEADAGSDDGVVIGEKNADLGQDLNLMMAEYRSIAKVFRAARR